jgi:hypothetical protein
MIVLEAGRNIQVDCRAKHVDQQWVLYAFGCLSCVVNCSQKFFVLQASLERRDSFRFVELSPCILLVRTLPSELLTGELTGNALLYL